MGVGVWEPGGDKPKTGQIDAELLGLLDLLPEDASLELLAQTGLADHQWLMKLDASAWQAAEELHDESLVHLVRLFTLLEMRVPGWDAGNQSPVIPLVKILKSREAFPAELRKWIKANTDNRYLPNGSAL